MAEVGRTDTRGRNGTLRPITARNRSGLRSAECHATGAPQSWPTITAVSAPRASSRPTMSPARWSRVYFSIWLLDASNGFEDIREWRREQVDDGDIGGGVSVSSGARSCGPEDAVQTFATGGAMGCLPTLD